jgi:hypothetical protein
MNRQIIINHRANLRLKRLVYQSRLEFMQQPVDFKLIDAMQQKMNRLLKTWKSDRVAANAKKHEKDGCKLSISIKSAI